MFQSVQSNNYNAMASQAISLKPKKCEWLVMILLMSFACSWFVVSCVNLFKLIHMVLLKILYFYNISLVYCQFFRFLPFHKFDKTIEIWDRNLSLTWSLHFNFLKSKVKLWENSYLSMSKSEKQKVIGCINDSDITCSIYIFLSYPFPE